MDLEVGDSSRSHPTSVFQQSGLVGSGWGRSKDMRYVSILVSMLVPEGPYIQPLGNAASKYHTIEGIMGPNSLMVVYVDPLGVVLIAMQVTAYKPPMRFPVHEGCTWIAVERKVNLAVSQITGTRI